jgi:hypothetical protein
MLERVIEERRRGDLPGAGVRRLALIGDDLARAARVTPTSRSSRC